MCNVHANSSFTKRFSFPLIFFTHLIKSFGLFSAYSMTIIIYQREIARNISLSLMWRPMIAFNGKNISCEGQWSRLLRTLVENYQRNLVSVLPFTGKYHTFVFKVFVVKQTKAKSFVRILHKPKTYFIGPSRIQWNLFLWTVIILHHIHLKESVFQVDAISAIPSLLGCLDDSYGLH